MSDPSAIGTAPLARKARALVLKIDECLPHIAAACILQAAHGMKYDGPTFNVELEALRSELDALVRAEAPFDDEAAITSAQGEQP